MENVPEPLFCSRSNVNYNLISGEWMIRLCDVKNKFSSMIRVDICSQHGIKYSIDIEFKSNWIAYNGLLSSLHFLACAKAIFRWLFPVQIIPSMERKSVMRMIMCLWHLFSPLIKWLLLEFVPELMDLLN